MNSPISNTPSQRCLISVIIPTFNLKACIRKCLESLREQTFRDFEILVIDGGSTDGTIKIVQEFASSFPRLTWRSEKDRGVYDAMNKGVAMARGDWVYFLGSD